MPVSGDRVIEQVSDHAMFLLDRHGRIASWNEGVQAIFGWSREDWIGLPVREIFTPRTSRPAFRSKSCSAPWRPAGPRTTAGCCAAPASASTPVAR
jgi:PAS domain-containing protein